MNLWTDGSSIGNPGPGGWAVVANGWSESGHNPYATSNYMELVALHVALQRIETAQEPDNHVYTDSRWALNMVLGLWQPSRKLVYREYVQEVRTYKKNMTAKVWIEWVRGHDATPQNHEADRLARMEAEKCS